MTAQERAHDQRVYEVRLGHAVRYIREGRLDVAVRYIEDVLGPKFEHAVAAAADGNGSEAEFEYVFGRTKREAFAA